MTRLPPFRQQIVSLGSSSRPHSRQSSANSDDNQSLKLKQLFTEFLENSGSFFENNANYIHDLQTFTIHMEDSSKNFAVFIGVVIKMCGSMPSLKQGRKPGLVSGASSIQNAANPFLKSWRYVSEFILALREKGSSDFLLRIQKTIKEIGGFVKLLQNQMVQKSFKSIQDSILSSYSDPRTRSELIEKSNQMIKIVNDETVYKDMSLESVQPIVNRLLNAINQDVRLSITYDKDSLSMYSAFASFQNLFQIFVDKLELNTILITVPELKVVSTREIPDEFSPSDDILSLALSGEESFKKTFSYIPSLQYFFSCLVETAKNNEERIMLSIEDTKNSFYEEIRGLETSNQRKEQTISVLQQENNQLKKEISQLQEKISISNINNQKIKDELSPYANYVYHLHDIYCEGIEKTSSESIIDKVNTFILNTIELAHSNDFVDHEKVDIQEPNITEDPNISIINDLHKKNEYYQSGFQKILSLFPPSNDLTVDIVDFSYNCAKKELLNNKMQLNEMNSKHSLIIHEICENISKISGSHCTTIDDSINVISQIISGNEVFLKEVEIRLSKLSNIPIGNKSIQESIRSFLMSMEKEMNTKPETILVQDKEIPEICYRLQRIINNSEDIGRHQYIQKIYEMLDIIESRFNKSSRIIINNLDPLQFQSTLEIIYSKLRKYLSIGNSDQTQSENPNELTHHIMSLLDGMMKSLLDGEIFRKHDIDSMFSDLLDSTLDSKRDPRLYIPDFCSQLIVFNNSIDILKPFSDILESIFESFDLRFSSFHPASDSFPKIRENVTRLQNELNKVAPTQINTMVFKTISNFVTLTNSFVSALSTISMNEYES